MVAGGVAFYGLMPVTVLIVEPGLATRDAAIAFHDRPVTEAMDALEVATGGRWRPAAGSWVLTLMPGLERFVMMPIEEVRKRNWALGQQFLETLAPSQLETLAGGGSLRPGEMTPGQVRLWSEKAALLYVETEGRMAPEALELQGAYIWRSVVHGGSERANSYRVNFCYPGTDGDNTTGFGSIPVDDPRLIGDGKPTRGPRIPIRIEGPTPQGPPRAAREDRRFRDDSRLDALVELPDRSVLAAAARLGESAKLSVLVTTVFGRRLLRVAKAKPSAREVLEAIEKVTGGRVRIAGETYVLQPNPSLERIGGWSPVIKRFRLTAQLSAVHAPLTPLQRRILDRTRELRPSQLGRAQRWSLGWATWIAYALWEDVDPAALDLRGVRIELDEEPGSPRQVTYLVPTVEGELEAIGRFPLK